MKTGSFLRILAVALALPIVVLQARPALEKPNFIVILLDDAGYANFSHSGHPTIETPNISKMAEDGMNFTNYYSAAAACSASRYGLLTGRHPLRSGFPWVIPPSFPRFIHAKEITIANILRDTGYATAIFGKWHVGTPNEANHFDRNAFPLAHGFNFWLGTNVSHDYLDSKLIRSDPEGFDPINGYRTLAVDLGLDHDWKVLKTLTRRYQDAAVDFIKANANSPFFAYIPLNFPHLQLAASDGSLHTSAAGLLGDTMTDIDTLVGTLRRTLEEKGITENTLIVFTSDNGQWIRFQDTASHPRYMEARLLVGSARPFRDGKGSTWEGGQREPGIWCWPGTIPARSTNRHPASNLDILPTLTTLAGGVLPTDRSIDGHNIAPYLNPSHFDGEVPEFTFFYEGHTTTTNAVRKGPWKLHIALYSQLGISYGYAPDSNTRQVLENPLLFNLELDPSERHNVAAEHPEIVKELRTAIENFEATAKKEGSFWDEK